MKTTIKHQLTQKFSGGCIDLEPDGTEFSLGEFGANAIGKAPVEEFEVSNRPPVQHQFNTDFCVSMQITYSVEQDTGLNLSQPFNFAAAKKRYYGNYYGFGLGIKDGLGSAQNDGIPLASLYSLYNAEGKQRESRNYLANWRNIPQEAWDDASKRKMTDGYFLIDIFPDKFDNFLAAMYNWDEPVITGIKWYNGFYVDSKERLVMRKTGSAAGHCIGGYKSVIVDGEQRLEFQNSWNSLPKFSLSRTQCKELYYGYILLPIHRKIVEIIQKYSGKIIRSSSGMPPIYLVQNGKKRHFPNENILNLYGISLDTFIEVPADEIASIPDGDVMSEKDLTKASIELVKRNNLNINK